MILLLILMFLICRNWKTVSLIAQESVRCSRYFSVTQCKLGKTTEEYKIEQGVPKPPSIVSIFLDSYWCIWWDILFNKIYPKEVSSNQLCKKPKIDERRWKSIFNVNFKFTWDLFLPKYMGCVCCFWSGRIHNI